MPFNIPPELAPRLAVGVAFGMMWLAWVISWVAAALWASRAAKRPPLKQEATYRLLTIAGAVLMYLQVPRGEGRPYLFWLAPVWLDWLLLAVAVAGLVFTWWARIYLGTLWSARVTRKEDHRIVDTGPYGVVRHPIYTGILAALYATALAFPGPFNGAGVVVLTIAFVIKARLEERFLMQELGAKAYADYRRRVPMLVPFWPAGST
jgi:protein-S-isoprenylcysteine O-methyltransferase Ste14